MERTIIDQGARLLHAMPRDFSALSCGLGCSRFGRRLGLLTRARRFVSEFWEKRLIHRIRVFSYERKLRDYNISHVMEKTAGEDNLIKRNAFDRLERYRVTVEDADASWTALSLYSTNDNEDEAAMCNYQAPVLREQEIAYKLVDGSVAAQHEVSASLDFREQQKQVMHQHKREKKILSALDHSNIIKPVIINGASETDSSWQARKRVVIETRSLSAAERCDLAATITKHDGVEENHQIDFDFEVVESFEEGPAGIPLPLAETTLIDEISFGLLSEQEKDDVARAMIDAVAYTHQRGCVHLNIKPANIVKIDGSWVLTGWTLAHHYRDMLGGNLDFMPAYNKQGYFFFGSDNYQAPQICVRKHFCTREMALEREMQAMKTGKGQALFCATDARAADAYSLGIVLFELLTGKNPTPSPAMLQYATPRCVEDIFQHNIDKCLREYGKSLGGYYKIVSSLLQSKCSDRISVATAQTMLEEMYTTDYHDREEEAVV